MKTIEESAATGEAPRVVVACHGDAHIKGWDRHEVTVKAHDEDVIDLDVQWTHANGTHYEEWTFDIGLDSLPSINDMLLTVIHIPEPATLSLLALGGLALMRKRK